MKIKATGRVKKFNDSFGYGYLEIEGQNREVFFHYTSIITDGEKTVSVGDLVSFDLIESASPVKPMALNVKLTMRTK